MSKRAVNRNSWSEVADYRLKNKKWLRYSSNIARRILAAIEEKEDFGQTDLARLLGVSPQYVSKIVKGKANMTLETIANISTVLKKELITFPEYKYSASSYQAVSGTTLQFLDLKYDNTEFIDLLNKSSMCYFIPKGVIASKWVVSTQLDQSTQHSVPVAA